MKVASFEKVEWIDPWRDRRPMTNDKVLVTGEYELTGERFVDIDYCDKGIWYWATLNNYKVIAWKPLEDPHNPVEEVE